jgi:hypothetical protein
VLTSARVGQPNENAEPFTRTKTADELLDKIQSAKTKQNGHADY